MSEVGSACCHVLVQAGGFSHPFPCTSATAARDTDIHHADLGEILLFATFWGTFGCPRRVASFSLMVIHIKNKRTRASSRCCCRSSNDELLMARTLQITHIVGAFLFAVCRFPPLPPPRHRGRPFAYFQRGAMGGCFLLAGPQVFHSSHFLYPPSVLWISFVFLAIGREFLPTYHFAGSFQR